MPKGGNGFLVFAEHMRDEFERQDGNRIPVDELVKLTSPYWQELSEHDKELWKLESKREEVVGGTDRGFGKQRSKPKKNNNKAEKRYQTRVLQEEQAHAVQVYFDESDSSQFSFQRKWQRVELSQELEWKSDERENSEEMKKKEVKEMKHYLLSATAYCETENHEFIPAEISLVVFSLAEGVITERTWIVAFPPELEELKSNSQVSATAKRHGIPLDNQSELLKGVRFCTSYNSLIQHMSNYNKEAKYYFISSANYNEVQGCLAYIKKEREKELCRKTNSIRPHQILCIEDLAGALYEIQARALPSDVLQEIQANCKFDSWRRFANKSAVLCSFHRKSEAKFCSLTKIKFALFGLFETLKPVYDLNLGPDHMPFTQKLSPIVEDEQSADSNLAQGRKPKSLPPTVLRAKRKSASKGDQPSTSAVSSLTNSLMSSSTESNVSSPTAVQTPIEPASFKFDKLKLESPVEMENWEIKEVTDTKDGDLTPIVETEKVDKSNIERAENSPKKTETEEEIAVMSLSFESNESSMPALEQRTPVVSENEEQNDIQFGGESADEFEIGDVAQDAVAKDDDLSPSVKMENMDKSSVEQMESLPEKIEGIGPNDDDDDITNIPFRCLGFGRGRLLSRPNLYQ